MPTCVRLNRLVAPQRFAGKAQLVCACVFAHAGASLCATEDGRRLYLFGGSDGTRSLNDVVFLELEKLSWTYVAVHVSTARASQSRQPP